MAHHLMRRLSRVVVFVLVFSLIGLPLIETAKSETTLRIPAPMTCSIYKSSPNGFDDFLLDEWVRGIASIYAWLDLSLYDSEFEVLIGQFYIGKDKDGEVLWYGLGGRSKSLILVYAPKQDIDNYTGMIIEFGGDWIPSFIDGYCAPLYHNDSYVIEELITRMKESVR